MMEDIIEPTMDYDFSKIYLGPPSNLAGGAYFTRLMHKTNKPLYIQTPKCLTKQGFIKSGKKAYTDLMFDNNDTVFINWIENLETFCQELIFNKSQAWFENKLEKDDIETAFTSPFKIFKSGKYYLLRVNVKSNIKIYDEHNQIVNIDDVSSDKTIISILEIQGIKFTSRNFQLEIELKQSMIVSPDPFLDECFIKKPIQNRTKSEINSNSVNGEEKNKEIEQINESIKDTNATYVNAGKDTSKEVEIELNLDEQILTPNRNHVELEMEEFVPEPEQELELELEVDAAKEDDPSILREVDHFNLENSLETITLKKPNQVYYEIYQKAREKAKEAKKNAITAYLEMKNIKKTYMLNDIDDSDSEFEEFAGSSEFSETESLEN